MESADSAATALATSSWIIVESDCSAPTALATSSWIIVESADSAATALATSTLIVLVSVPTRFGLSPSEADSSRNVSSTAGALSTSSATFWSTYVSGAKLVSTR